MSYKGTRKILKHAVKPGMTKDEAHKAEMEMAIGCIISQKMLICKLRRILIKHGLSDLYEAGDME